MLIARGFKRRLFTGLMGGTALMLALGGNVTHAALTYCRSDPMVTLSNGVTVTLWANTATDAASIAQVDYVLHVPKGLSVQSVTYDNSGVTENLSVIADQTGTQYSDSTTVYLISGQVATTVYATRRDATVASKSGNTGQTITLHWCT